MPGRLLVLSLTGVWLAMTAVGCGGSDPPTVSASSLDRAQFVDRVEAICARGRLQGLRYQPPSDERQLKTEAQAERIEDDLLPAIQQVVDEIYAVGSPRGEEAKVERLLVAMQAAIDAANELPVPSLERVERLFIKPGKLAKQEGLEACIYG